MAPRLCLPVLQFPALSGASNLVGAVAHVSRKVALPGGPGPVGGRVAYTPSGLVGGREQGRSAAVCQWVSAGRMGSRAQVGGKSGEGTPCRGNLEGMTHT